MFPRGTTLRLLRGAVAAALLAGAITTVLVPPTAASAAPIFQSPPLISWRYTVSRQPDRSVEVTDSNVPIGAWLDPSGRLTRSRTYVQYDISGFQGRRVMSAKLFFQEYHPSSCVDRMIEVWETKDSPAEPTWRNPREEKRLLSTVGGSATCGDFVTVDLTDPVASAIAHGRTRFSIELRLPHEDEGDLAKGRQLYWFYGVRMSIGYNTPPTVVPQHLYNNYLPCDRSVPYQFLAGAQPSLQAMYHDPDQGSNLTGESRSGPSPIRLNAPC